VAAAYSRAARDSISDTAVLQPVTPYGLGRYFAPRMDTMA